MTIKEFSVKYGVPYNIVYDASCEMKYKQLSPYDHKQYDEKVMFDVVVRVIKQRIKRYQELADRQIEILNRLR